MDWQSVGVVFVVAGAVYFLGRRLFVARRQRTRPAQTFVPLSSIKKRSDTGCH